MSNILFKKVKRILKDEGVKGLFLRIKHKYSKPILSPQSQLNSIKFHKGTIDIVIENDINYYDIKKQLNKLNYSLEFFGFKDIIDSDYQILNYYTFNNVFYLRSFIYISNKKECPFNHCVNMNFNDETTTKIKEMIKSLKGIKLFSNYNDFNNISVKTSTFFDSFGTNYYSGGAERYLLDLHQVCEAMSLNLNVYQNALTPFFRKYNDVNIIGLKPKDTLANYTYQYADSQTKNYIFHTYNNTQLHIYSAFQECFPNHIGPSIGISHGISWDHKLNKIENAPKFWDEKQNIIIGAMFCTKLVSVDTNTPNWFQTIDYNLGNHKFSVIPNYVDNETFQPRKDYLEKRNKIIITYPRRLYEPRGLYIALEVVDKILKEYDNIEFHFVGKGFDIDITKIKEKIKKYPNKIYCYNKSPFEMPDVYKNSDISLIPTQYSEGTSLSCLEAMASGNIVVATRIGGLTDLVINKLNGYLIEPDSESLYENLKNIIDNYDLQKSIRLEAIKTADVFNKNIWKLRWQKQIESFHLKGKSNNNELIEFYVKDINNISEKMIIKIKEELIKGNLIYIRLKKLPDIDLISHSLIQLVSNNEEIVSEPKIIYIEKGLEINRKCKNIQII